MLIEPAASDDLDALRALLRTADLPHEDLTPVHLAHFLGARDEGGLCGDGEAETRTIESGTHAGTITAVNPEETEVYVEFQEGASMGVLHRFDGGHRSGRLDGAVRFACPWTVP